MCPYGKETEGDSRKKRKPCDHRDRKTGGMQSQAKKPAAARNQEKTKQGLSSSTGRWSCWHPQFSRVKLISDFCFQTCNRINLCSFKPPNCGHLL
jgi:hypothetical protein